MSDQADDIKALELMDKDVLISLVLCYKDTIFHLLKRYNESRKEVARLNDELARVRRPTPPHYPI